MSALNHFLNAISDHGNTIMNKGMYAFGYLSVGTGATLGVVNDTMERINSPTLWTLQDYAAIVAMVGGVTIIIKNLVDLYFTIINRGKK